MVRPAAPPRGRIPIPSHGRRPRAGRPRPPVLGARRVGTLAADPAGRALCAGSWFMTTYSFPYSNGAAAGEGNSVLAPPGSTASLAQSIFPVGYNFDVFPSGFGSAAAAQPQTFFIGSASARPAPLGVNTVFSTARRPRSQLRAASRAASRCQERHNAPQASTYTGTFYGVGQTSGVAALFYVGAFSSVPGVSTYEAWARGGAFGTSAPLPGTTMNYPSVAMPYYSGFPLPAYPSDPMQGPPGAAALPAGLLAAGGPDFPPYYPAVQARWGGGCRVAGAL